ncbi:MAG: hypothetical protein M1828_006035 [Chrysothrix sp. TS-e1954]|nr:MAG: hypothetical protein M1828_006035 [Chrysothrix sp. TS-e1954]
MSLNGLDSLAVENAYKAALARPNGWLLLRYTSRDAIGLLGKLQDEDDGTDGFEHIRTTLAGVPDKSPIYGFVQHEGQKFLLKHIPEGTSRLLIARTTVHFRSVTEKFSPHDIVVESRSIDEVSPTSLSGSNEISPPTQDTQGDQGHETSAAKRHGPKGSETSALPGSETSDGREQNTPASTIEHQATTLSNGTSTPREYFEKPYLPSESSKPVTNGSSEMMGLKAFLTNVTPPASTRANKNTFQGGGVASPSSSRVDLTMPDDSFYKQSLSSRPSAADLFRHLKPKTRLFPRPVDDERMRKPQTAAGFRQKLPTGLRSKPRRSESDRPVVSKVLQPQRSNPPALQSQPSTMAQATSPPEGESPFKSKAVKSPSPKSASPDLNNKELPRPPSPWARPSTNIIQAQKSAQKAKPRPTLDLSKKRTSSATDSPVSSPDLPVRVPSVLSPEKQRLMRALQLRKQQQKDQTASPDLPLERLLDADKEDDVARQNTDSSKADSAIAVDADTKAGTEQPVPLRMRKATPMPQMNGLDMHPLRSQPIQTNVEPRDPVDPPDESAQHVVHDELSSKPIAMSPSRAKSPAEYIDVGQLDAEVTRPVSLHSEESPAAQVRARAKRKAKRRGVFEPLELPEEKDDAEVEAKSLPDGDLVEELQDAKVEEATSVRLTQSPQRNISVSTRSVAFSGVDRRDTGSNEQSPRSPKRQRSATGRPSQDRSGSFAKRVNVSSGISKRIQALAEISARESPPPSPYESTSPGQSSRPMFSMRSMSSQNALHRRSFTLSRQSSPTRSRPQTANARTNADSQAHPTVSRLSTSGRRRESNTVSVLIQDSHRSRGTRPPLVTDIIEEAPHHARSMSNVSFARSELMPPGISSPRPESRQSTVASIPRKSFDHGGRFGRRSDTRHRPPTSMSNISLERVDEQSESKVSNSSSRATRLFKRMSGLSAAIRRPPSEARGSRLSRDGSSTAPSFTREQLPPQSVAIGDLNVQFPDTLLWKRRWVEVDAVGNLVLSASRVNERPRGIKKKFHLSEFRPPLMPAQDRQEMPNSESMRTQRPCAVANVLFAGVIFDIIGGGTLQLACEDPVAQSQIFRSE